MARCTMSPCDKGTSEERAEGLDLIQRITQTNFNLVLNINSLSMTQKPVFKLIFVSFLCFFCHAKSQTTDSIIRLSGEEIKNLKLTEAKAQGLDTLSSFKQEMSVFRKELIQSFTQENKLPEEKDPEIRSMLEKYKEGLLIFNITQKEVWEKAYTDTLGLTNFFEKNKGNYKWEQPRFKGFVVHAKTKKRRERIQQEVAGMEPGAAAAFLRQKYITTDSIHIKISKKKLFAAGDDEYVDELIFKTGRKGVPYLEFPRYFVVGKLLYEPEKYTDVIALVSDDYMKLLEQEWIEKLAERWLGVEQD